jgi:hypothetical protein
MTESESIQPALLRQRYNMSSTIRPLQHSEVDRDTSAELSAFDRWKQQSAVITDSEDKFKAFIPAPPSRLPTLEGRQLTVIE